MHGSGRPGASTKMTSSPMSKARTRPTRQPHVGAYWLPEPEVAFSGGQPHVDPKVGITLYGPNSFATERHKQEVHVALVGTGPDLESAARYFDWAADGVDGDADHAPFPGCRPGRGFRTQLRFSDYLHETITQNELRAVTGLRGKKDKFQATLDLFRSKLAGVVDRDHPLDVLFVVVPQVIYDACHSVDYHERGRLVHRDLRSAFKAMAMELDKPTQLLRPSTFANTDTRRDLDEPAVIAWNLFTGTYFKVDGLPWSPHGLPAGSCFIGISFYRPIGESSNLRTSVVQAFDENGEGLILRGHNFHWDEKREGRSPHLQAEQAFALVDMVLRQYRANRKMDPVRVVVHKSSRFERPETEGFLDALKKVRFTDLVAIRPTSDTRLIRAAEYPPLRGTAFEIGDITYLYTVGYIPELGRYPHGHVPSPLQLADRIGDTAPRQLFSEILTLTKMNWNSAGMYEQMPITLRFAHRVGDILRECGDQQRIQSKYKFYM